MSPRKFVYIYYITSHRKCIQIFWDSLYFDRYRTKSSIKAMSADYICMSQSQSSKSVGWNILAQTISCTVHSVCPMPKPPNLLIKSLNDFYSIVRYCDNNNQIVEEKVNFFIKCRRKCNCDKACNYNVNNKNFWYFWGINIIVNYAIKHNFQ